MPYYLEQALTLFLAFLHWQNANPVAGKRLYAEPNRMASKQADAWQDTRPQDAARMKMLAGRPGCAWFGEWSGDIYTAVNDYVTRAHLMGAVPCLVSYYIPHRDICSGYSSGGAKDASEYLNFAKSFSLAVGPRLAIVVLEPDSIESLDCATPAGQPALSPKQQRERLNLLREFGQLLKTNSRAIAYASGGHSKWKTPEYMADKLTQVGTEFFQGVAINFSNRRPLHELLSADPAAPPRYAEQLSALLGGTHYIIDVSRNGNPNPPDEQWCNPSWEVLGPNPSTVTFTYPKPLKLDALVDGKVPGESDGTCNGGPPAGQWWPEKALNLVTDTEKYGTVAKGN